MKACSWFITDVLRKKLPAPPNLWSMLIDPKGEEFGHACPLTGVFQDPDCIDVETLLCWTIVFLRVWDYDTSSLDEKLLTKLLADVSLEHSTLAQPVNQALPHMPDHLRALARYRESGLHRNPPNVLSDVDEALNECKTFWQAMWDRFDEKSGACAKLFKNKPLKKWQLFLLSSCTI